MKSVVIGGDIYALRYAFQHDLPLIYVEAKKPHRHSGSQQAEWHHLYWCLSIAGKVKFASFVSSVVVDSEEGSAKIIYNNRSKIIEGIEKFYIFDETGISGLPPSVGMSSDKNEVFDWINVRSGMKHDLDRIESASPFMQCILFYPTERIAGDHALKDVCVISCLTDEELKEFEYSELVVKIKTEEAMKKAGIKGTGNGVGKYLSIKLESDKRECYPIGVPVYKEVPDSIVFRPEANIAYPSSEGQYLNYIKTVLIDD